jgi:glutamate-1-semialdehyde 2,1-aminomutase
MRLMLSQAAASRRSLADRYTAAFPLSRQLAQRAREVLPNGVTHDLRALEPFGIYVDRAEGSRKWTVEGRELIDFWSGHGSLLLGHSHPAVVEAVRRQAGRATHPGACHELEIEWGGWVQRLVPTSERVRFVSSGTEATLMALRLARIATGRPRVLKLAGHFHGWHDFLIPGADGPTAGQSVPGIPPAVAAQTVIVPPNDPDAVERALRDDPEIGCVILEPTGGHFGAVPIRAPFLVALRELTTRLDRLLIFDEVVTGFRVAPGGAQELSGVRPDLTTLAKVLAGGLPGACVAGRADILAALGPRRGKPRMYHPGTFNANPLSAAAGCAVLELVSSGEPCRRASAAGRSLRQRLNALFAQADVPWVAYGEHSFFRLLPGYDGPRSDGDDFIPYQGEATQLDAPKDPALVGAFRQAMLLCGVDLPGLAGITSAAHTEADVEQTVQAVAAALELLREEGLL